MTTSRLVRGALFPVAALLLAACAAGPSPTAPAADEPHGGGTAPVVDTRGGLLPTGRALADVLRSRYPDYADGWHLAVGWDPRAPWMGPVGDGVVQRWHGCVLLKDLGAVAANEDQAFVQLDPSTFSGLVWIVPDLSPGGTVEAFTVGLRSTQGAPLVHVRVSCEPPLPLLAAPSPGASGAARRWLALDAPARALFWEEPAGRLWAALPDRILRLDPATREPVQTLPLPQPGSSAGGRALLGSLGDEGAPRRVGYFDLGAGAGWWYDLGAGGSFARGAALDGLPLSDRLRRFFTGPFDPSTLSLQLTDYREKSLGEGVDVVRFMGASGSLFGILRPDGSWSVLRGDDLSLTPAPETGPVSAMGSFGPLLLVAGSDGTLRGYRMAKEMDTWVTVFSRGPLPGAVTALCGGTLNGRPTAFVAVEDQGRGEILTLDLPAAP